MPSGNFELVFNLREDELRIYKPHNPQQCDRLPGAIVSGPYNRFFVTDTAEEASVMGVHFKQGGAFPFLGVPADELADTHIALETVWGRCAGEIREQVCATASPLKRFRLLEETLLRHLFRPLTHHAAVALALDTLARSSSRALVRKLAREAGPSERRFIDVFRFEVGLKPKLFNRVLRFQRVLRLLPRIPASNWAQLALDEGYFDQSHLIRDFLAFSGFAPADWLRRLRDLRVLHQVSRLSNQAAGQA